MQNSERKHVLRLSKHVIVLITAFGNWRDRSRDTWKGEVEVVSIKAVQSSSN